MRLGLLRGNGGESAGSRRFCNMCPYRDPYLSPYLNPAVARPTQERTGHLGNSYSYMIRSERPVYPGPLVKYRLLGSLPAVDLRCKLSMIWCRSAC
jgi:hypothetical protein